MRNLDPTNFDEAISGEKAVIIDFWAGWCMPCKLIAPAFEELSGELADKADFAKVDIEVYPQYAEKYGIENIPAILVFKNGEETGRSVGLKQKPALKEELESYL